MGKLLDSSMTELEAVRYAIAYKAARARGQVVPGSRKSADLIAVGYYEGLRDALAIMAAYGGTCPLNVFNMRRQDVAEEYISTVALEEGV